MSFMPGILRYRVGNVTIPEAGGFRIIIQIVNDLGVIGAGVSGAISKRWPLITQEYKKWYRSQTNFKGGQVQEIQVQSDTSIVNMIVQHGITAQTNPSDPPIRYEQLAECLEKVAILAKNSSASVHAPRIGAGLAANCSSGFDPEVWAKIEQLLIEKLVNKGINVTIYDLPVKKEPDAK